MTEQGSTGEALKACPYCSAPAERFIVAGSYGYYSPKQGTRCSNKDCAVRPSVAFETERYDWSKRRYYDVPAQSLADAAWNTRPSPASEPVAWMDPVWPTGAYTSYEAPVTAYYRKDWTPLYVHPPADRALLDEVREALAAAYSQGATDVHNSWIEGTNGGEPDFGEAASDYAAHAIAKLEAKP